MKCALFLITLLVSIQLIAQDGIPSKEEIDILLERHNDWRARVGVAPLAWSDEVAKSAYDWAKKLKRDNCGFYHSDSDYGENLWMGTTGYYTVADVVESWCSEIEDYDYDKNKCKPGKMCGHYTQVVWNTTTQVGCASIQDCDGNTLWVCQYNPPGNWVGKKPY